MTASELPARGTLYGYEIRSPLEFEYLRLGEGEPLTVMVGDPPDSPPGELLRTWAPPEFPVQSRLHADGTAYRLWYERDGWYVVEPGARRLVVPSSGDSLRREERLWGLPILLHFMARGDVPLHASCVEVDGKALLLAAPGKHGKTTLAMAFAALGYRVLAEDLVCLRPGSAPAVIPGPAMLRVRNDMADVCRVPGAAELRRDDERAHLSLESSRGTCDPVPVAGIVMLHVGDTEPRLERVAGADVVRNLWALSFNLPTDRDRARCFQAVAALGSTTSTWNLTRRLRLEDLMPTVECVVDALDRRP